MRVTVVWWLALTWLALAAFVFVNQIRLVGLYWPDGIEAVPIWLVGWVLTQRMSTGRWPVTRRSRS